MVKHPKQPPARHEPHKPVTKTWGDPHETTIEERREAIRGQFEEHDEERDVEPIPDRRGDPPPDDGGSALAVSSPMAKQAGISEDEQSTRARASARGLDVSQYAAGAPGSVMATVERERWIAYLLTEQGYQGVKNPTGTYAVVADVHKGKHPQHSTDTLAQLQTFATVICPTDYRNFMG